MHLLRRSLVMFSVPEVIPDILEFSFLEYGLEGLERALREFNLYGHKYNGEFHNSWHDLFVSWYLFDWLPDDRSFTPADDYLHCYQDLPSIEKNYINILRCAVFGFYQVLDVLPGRQIDFINLMTKEEVSIKEEAYSHLLRPGNVIFAKIAGTTSHKFIMGLSPRIFGPSSVEWIIKWLAEDDDVFTLHQEITS